jgi:hypothetical protein
LVCHFEKRVLTQPNGGILEAGGIGYED